MHSVNLIKLNATSSTNDVIKQGYAHGKFKDGDLIWTSEQTKGRGQRNNTWISEPKKNLAFSIYKEFDTLAVSNAFLVSCIVSIAIVEALKMFQVPNVSIKWPNDIMAGTKKIGGILIENVVQGNKITASIMGVGLNVNQKEFKHLPQATSLAIVTQKEYVLETVLAGVVKHYHAHLQKITTGQPEVIQEQFTPYLFGLDLPYIFQRGANEFTATIRGVSKNGALILEYNNGTMEQVYYPDVKMCYPSFA